MKYWNKQHEVRKRCWTKVTLPQDNNVMFSNKVQQYFGWHWRGDFENTKHKLQLNPSTGKFYMGLFSKEIWFEHSKDSTWFILSQ